MPDRNGAYIVYREYDEDSELTDYIWRSFQHLLTDPERAVYEANHLRGMLEREPCLTKIENFSRGARIGDTEIDEALKDGLDVFLKRVRDRVLKEHGEEVTISRCPACDRILWTPGRKLCNWCNHCWRKKDK
jgi:hypothetical protein